MAKLESALEKDADAIHVRLDRASRKLERALAKTKKPAR